MSELSLKEITNICSLISQQILMYYKDVMLGDSPSEQALVNQHMMNIPLILSAIEKIDRISTRIPSIKIKHFNLAIYDNGAKTEMPFKLEPAYFQILGPIGMMEVLLDVFRSALSSIHITHLTTSQAARMAYARRDLAYIICSLTDIALRITDLSAYLVKSTSELFSIDFDLEIKYS
jgi:hypothetical protein